MKLSEIQPTLKTVLSAIALFSAQADTLIRIDDGLQMTVMEDTLKDSGLVILIMQPQGLQLQDSTRGAVKIGYTTTVWLRTNPKVKNVGGTAPLWNPFACEEAILNAVLQFSKARSDFGFFLTPNAEPETDWTDAGNVSRLIRFSTGVHFH
jgi:hypothetical protein